LSRDPGLMMRHCLRLWPFLKLLGSFALTDELQP